MQHKLSELNFKNEDDLESENLQINFDPKSKEHLDKCQKIANLLVKDYQEIMKPLAYAESLFLRIQRENNAYFDSFNHENPEKWSYEFEYINFFINIDKKECIIVDYYEFEKRKKLEDKCDFKNKHYCLSQNELDLETNKRSEDFYNLERLFSVHEFNYWDFKIIFPSLSNLVEKDLSNLIRDYETAFKDFLESEDDENIKKVFIAAAIDNDDKLFSDFSELISAYSDSNLIELFAYRMQCSDFNNDEKRCNYIKQNLRKMIDDNYKYLNKEV